MERSLWNPLCKVTAGAKDERAAFFPAPALTSLSGASVEERALDPYSREKQTASSLLCSKTVYLSDL